MADAVWVKVQQKTFSRWVNLQFKRGGLPEVANVASAFADSVALPQLVEILFGEPLSYNKTPKMRIQKLENINAALRAIKNKGIRLIGIGSEDILDQKLILILGVLWTLIMYTQIQKGNTEISAKQGMIDFVSKTLGTDVKNFTSEWQNGVLLWSLVEKLSGGNSSDDSPPTEKIEKAIKKAHETLGVPILLDAKDIAENPDELSMLMYISYFRDFSEKGIPSSAPSSGGSSSGSSGGSSGGNSDTSQSRVFGPGLESGEAGSPFCFTATARNSSGICVHGAKWEVHVTTITGDEVPVKIVDNNDDTFAVTYVPKEGGTHYVNVSVNGMPINGSPFNVMVSPKLT